MAVDRQTLKSAGRPFPCSFRFIFDPAEFFQTKNFNRTGGQQEAQGKPIGPKTSVTSAGQWCLGMQQVCWVWQQARPAEPAA